MSNFNDNFELGILIFKSYQLFNKIQNVKILHCILLTENALTSVQIFSVQTVSYSTNI